MGDRTAPRVSCVTSLLTARRSEERSACCSATAWNCTMGWRLVMASCTSLFHRLMTSALAGASWMAPASTADATTGDLSTTACFR